MWYDFYWGSLPLNLSNLSPKKLAKYQNNLEFQNNFQNLYTTALNIFKWNNLPDTCDERMIERSLLLSGRVIFAEVDGGILSLAGAGCSALNIYGYPVRGWGWGFNGFNREFDLYVKGSGNEKTARAVLGYDNATQYPFINYIINAADRLTNAVRTMDVIVQNLKQPIIVSCDEQSVNSVREVLNNRDSNGVAIISNGKLPVDNFKVWDTKANPQILAEMRNHYEWLDTRNREILGIKSNTQPDKRERLLVDEVNANDQSTEISVDKRLTWREKLCEDINTVFNLNVSVELRNPPAGPTDYNPDTNEEVDDNVDE